MDPHFFGVLGVNLIFIWKLSLMVVAWLLGN